MDQPTALTQKDALRTLLHEAFEDPRFAYVFVFMWLEDINWHREARMLYGQLDQWVQEGVDGIMRNMNTKLTPNDTHKIAYYWFMDGKDFNANVEKTNFYKCFTYLYGWGLDNSWENTKGQAFVDELVQLV